MRETGKSVQRHMGAIEGTVHGIMLIFSLGLWTPVYLKRKHQIERTVVHYGR